jgi:ATP-dependent DNA helicase RecG
MLISVWEGANKPYYFKNTIYTRRGAKTIVSKGAGIDNLLYERKFSEQRWERQAVLGATFDDLDLGELKKSLEAYKNYANDSTINDAESFLINRGLIINGNITNACMVLFGKNPSRFIPQSRIRLVVYPGTTSGDSFIENKVIENNIFQNIETIRAHFDSIIGKEIKIEGAFRTEKKKYPEMALREGLLNAIVHRDYGDLRGFLTISIYSNRLVISNYGGLPEELTVKDLKTDHNSILRNPDIAQMCFYRRYIEMLGTGTLRMIRECKSEGFNSPVWKSKGNILELTFSGVNHQYEGVNEGVKLNDEGVKLNIEGVNEGVNEELTLLYNQIAKYPGKKANELKEQLNKSLSTTERYLKILKQHGFIKFEGAPKTGGYYLFNGE